ncbi:YihY/virulence factor BrkB family protein [Cellulomonas sp. 179-A 9B4 NHS]|uniref:YihY/virulence factor BrkB family protein n=1 Tax=Cellulomonas sp. 179-A 9B4 NHS TaxID=3142379 RepID=UPI0039A1C351
MNKSSTSKAATAPAPDDPRKPDSPDDLEKRSWKYVLRKTFREFGKDQCTDLAAALTYYGVLAVAPALLAIVSLLGFVSDPERAVERILGLVDDIAPGGATDTIEPILQNLTQAPAAGLALVVGLVTALWSASGYVAAFSRGMNRVYEIDEGRPIWKLRPILLLVTLVLVVIAVLVVAMLVLSGGVARTVGDAVGLSGTAVTVWNIAKWPVVVVLVALAIAILYHATPNVRQPKFRWVSVGAFVAIVVWVLASLGFAFYVANFSSYNETYGSLAGVIIALLWLWITNLALLFGAELDAELERGRQLQGGIEAERSIQLPPRDTKASDKKQAKAEDDVRRGREVREAAQRRQSDDGGEHGRDGGDRGGESRGGSHAARRES